MAALPAPSGEVERSIKSIIASLAKLHAPNCNGVLARAREEIAVMMSLEQRVAPGGLAAHGWAALGAREDAKSALQLWTKAAHYCKSRYRTSPPSWTALDTRVLGVIHAVSERSYP